jgi:hypothetical protein
MKKVLVGFVATAALVFAGVARASTVSNVRNQLVVHEHLVSTHADFLLGASGGGWSGAVCVHTYYWGASFQNTTGFGKYTEVTMYGSYGSDGNVIHVQGANYNSSWPGCNPYIFDTVNGF